MGYLIKFWTNSSYKLIWVYWLDLTQSYFHPKVRFGHANIIKMLLRKFMAFNQMWPLMLLLRLVDNCTNAKACKSLTLLERRSNACTVCVFHNDYNGQMMFICLFEQFLQNLWKFVEIMHEDFEQQCQPKMALGKVVDHEHNSVHDQDLIILIRMINY